MTSGPGRLSWLKIEATWSLTAYRDVAPALAKHIQTESKAKTSNPQRRRLGEADTACCVVLEVYVEVKTLNPLRQA